jgi:glycerate kinase
MRIVCVPDSFKETLRAADVAQAMAAGARRADSQNECDECPVGDGGEGTIDAMISASGGTRHTARVTGPMGEPITAHFAINSEGVGIVELAQASGLSLVPAALRDPTRTTTFGTGELIRAAMEHGCREIIVCIGGSATIDGGAGIVQALGAQFIDRDGHVIERPMTGGLLARVSRVNRSPLRLPASLRVACDVTNPLCGSNGAAAIYGPQKGATSQQVIELDAALEHFAEIAGGDRDRPATGAAGGAAFGLMSLCGAELERGIELVLDAVRFDDRCRDADLVLTGEGRLDAQSLQGKACTAVAAHACALGVETIAIVGSTGPGAEDCTRPEKGGLLREVDSLAARFGPERAMREPAALIEEAAFEIARRRQVR